MPESRRRPSSVWRWWNICQYEVVGPSISYRAFPGVALGGAITSDKRFANRTCELEVIPCGDVLTTGDSDEITQAEFGGGRVGRAGFRRNLPWLKHPHKE